jgi:ferric-dicitrate binding protein FerR (iron transport regulator)
MKNTMHKMDIKQLMDNYLGDKASPQERAEAQEFADFLAQQADLEGTLLELKSKYLHELNRAPEQIRSRRRRYALVAAFAVLLISGSMFYLSRQQSQVVPQGTYTVTNFFPAKDAAILKLANGKAIVLDASDTGQIYNSDGLLIHYAGHGMADYSNTHASAAVNSNAFDEIIVPRGGQYGLKLPDGTTVTLNADSQLKFKHRFNETLRTVYLQGEAFFAVADDPERPFQVVSSNQSIKVLGTSFNVSSYVGEPVQTTVVTGKVRLNTQDTSRPQEQILTENQQAIYVSGKVISVVSDITTTDAISWKDGQYVLDQVPLKQALIKLSRWFDVDVDTTNIKNNRPINASFSKKDSLSAVLSNIQRASKVKMELQGKRIVVR